MKFVYMFILFAQFAFASQESLGIKYFNEQEYKKALEVLLPIEKDSKNRELLYSLGVIYEYGEGVRVDGVKAVYYYERAAKLGSTEALTSLGLLYEEGEIVDVDLNKAFHWYRQASLLGDNIGKCMLAKMYYYGLGTQSNNKHYNFLMSEALKDGDEEEKGFCEDLKGEIEAEENLPATFSLDAMSENIKENLQKCKGGYCVD